MDPDDIIEEAQESEESLDLISPAAKARLRRFMESRVDRDEAKQAFTAAEKTYREMEADMYELLEDATGGKTLPVDLGEPFGVVKFRTRETFYAEIIDADKAQEHYEQRAMMDEVSAPKFVMARLNEEVRTAKELNQSMPPGISFRANRGVTITRQK